MIATSRPWFWLRFASLAASLLLLLGLNQRALNVPVGRGEDEAVARLAKVSLRVVLESPATASFLLAPPVLAGPPEPVRIPMPWPGRPRAVAAPRPLAGVGAAEVFRARLLAMSLSPQAP